MENTKGNNLSEALFILNPNSGRKGIDDIRKKLEQHPEKPAFVLTRDKAGFEQEMNENLEKFRFFVAVGGDGTVSELVKYLFQKEDKVLAVFPNGSGNGFANEMGFDHHFDNLLADIRRGESFPIDVLGINDQKCVNVAGMGFDAAVAHSFHKGKSRGFINYIWASVKTWFGYRNVKIKITTGDFEHDGTYFIVTVANTRQFGNNAIISPGSDAADGKFEIVLVKNIPLYYYPVVLYRFFKGNLTKSKWIDFLEFEAPVTLETSHNYFHIDGEPFLSEGTYKISLFTQAVNILKRN